MQATLKHAMEGRRILLILDDLWHPPHEGLINFVDEATASKVLISTRTKGLLADGDSVEVQLPKLDDAMKILMAAAAATTKEAADQPPPEAADVVALCGRLPLALDIAGKVCKGLLADGSTWSQVPGSVRQLMGLGAGAEVETGAGVDDRIIAASLNSMTGTAGEMENTKSLFLLFALVPVSLQCPPIRCLWLWHRP